MDWCIWTLNIAVFAILSSPDFRKKGKKYFIFENTLQLLLPVLCFQLIIIKYIFSKSCIRETPTLSTNAGRRTATILRDYLIGINFYFWRSKKKFGKRVVQIFVWGRSLNFFLGGGGANFYLFIFFLAVKKQNKKFFLGGGNYKK